MTDRYDDELKLVLEDLADLMQNEASPKKSKMLQLLMNNKSERNQMCTLPYQFLMKHIEILVNPILHGVRLPLILHGGAILPPA